MFSTARHSLRRFAWIAGLAIFGLVLAPQVSKLRVLQGVSATWASVCTVRDAGPQAPAHDVVDHAGHCPLCGLGSVDIVTPPPVVLAVPRLALRDGPPPHFFLAPRPAFAWSPTQTRGPPSSI